MPRAMTTLRPHAVAFDVVETIFALDPVGDALGRVGSSADRLDLFFARLLRDAFALNVTGEYRAFPEVGQRHPGSPRAVALRRTATGGARCVPHPRRPSRRRPGVRPAGQRRRADPGCDQRDGRGDRTPARPGRPSQLREQGGERRRVGDVEAPRSRLPPGRHRGGRRPGPLGAGGGSRLGRPRGQAGRSHHRVGVPQLQPVSGDLRRARRDRPDLLTVVESLLALPAGHTVRS